MHEVRTGVWDWEAPHPDWKPGADWAQRVSSYAIEADERLLLLDPLSVPAELQELAASRSSC